MCTVPDWIAAVGYASLAMTPFCHCEDRKLAKRAEAIQLKKLHSYGVSALTTRNVLPSIALTSTLSPVLMLSSPST